MSETICDILRLNVFVQLWYNRCFSSGTYADTCQPMHSSSDNIICFVTGKVVFYREELRDSAHRV